MQKCRGDQWLSALRRNNLNKCNTFSIINLAKIIKLIYYNIKKEVKNLKNNTLKYIVIAIVLAIIYFVIYSIYSNNKPNEENIVQSTEYSETQVFDNIRLAISEFDTMNPILSNNKNVQDISKLIFDSLLTFTEDFKVQNSLAEEWSKVGNTTYVIKLKSGIKWSDGSDFSAYDVLFTIDRLKEVASIYSYNVQYVIGAEVIDNNTIKLELDREVPFFEYNLIFPILSENYYEGEDFVNTAKNQTPLSTGAYYIDTIADSVVTLKFNKHYREPEEEFKIKQIDINLYNSMGEVYNAFKLGNIDLINTNVANIEDYIGTIGFAKKEYKARQYDYLALNCTNSVLSNKLVRQAIMYGIDKNYIVANVYNNKYKISEFPLDFGSYLYNSEKSVWSYNPDKVKEILTADGWELKNNVWQKKINYRTTRLSFNLSVNSNDANRVRVAEVIKEMLEANGIQVNIVKLSESNYNANLANKNYDIILTGMNIYATPDLTTYIGENNKANFVNDEILGLQNDVKNITDESILKEKYDRILEIYNDEVPYIGLYNSLGTVIYSNNLIADISPNWYNIFYNIRNWVRQ